jgi:TatD DNase family protein
VVSEAVEAGVARLIDVGTDLARSQEAADTARRRPEVAATAGVHPHEARHGIVGLEELLDGGAFVAVGECGLDYHYDHSPRDAQRDVFVAQVGLAHRFGLPLVIHTREAWHDTFAVLDSEGVPHPTVFHCFTGGPDEARRALDLGAHLSFSGIVTFRSADDLREAARLCPVDRILVETDAPYLAPEPHRGRPNRPALLPVVGARLAEVKGLEVADLARVTAANAARVYGGRVSLL